MCLNIRRTISVPPDVQLSGSSTVKEGEPTALTCDASSGNPDKYTYSWKFSGKYDNNGFVDLPSGFQYQNSGRQVQLTNTQYNNAGTYKCTATNTGGSKDAEKAVTVQCKYT